MWGDFSMRWSDFYDGFWDWSDSTRRTRISSLEDMGSGEEIVEVIYEIEDPKVRSQLIRKAMKMGAVFTSDDFMNLDGELTGELYEELGKYAGFDHNDPYFDEDNMTWDDFYNCYCDWTEEILARRIQKLSQFGNPGEVCEAIQCMPSSALEDLLHQKALAAGVNFSGTDLDDDPEDEIVDMDEGYAEPVPKHHVGFWGALIGLLSGIGSNSHHDTGRCDGNCANCPAHYGYRYGRWYYGHGHQHGCERGGNGGASGRTYRD